jgi:hypothetical protein
MTDDLERRLSSLSRMSVGNAPPLDQLDRTRSVWRRPLVAAATVLAVLAGAVAIAEVRDTDESVHTTGAPTSSAETAMTADTTGEILGPPDSPPSVRVQSTDTQLDLEPWTYCWQNGCADGFLPPEDIEDIGGADDVTVTFPVENWSFEASFKPTGQECGREYPATLKQVGPTEHRLTAHGPVGTYDVTLFGRGNDDAEQGGDLFVTFRWTTDVNGPLPTPRAETSILADHDGRVDSYGVSLGVQHLGMTPTDASATVVVTASNGDSMQLDLPFAGSTGCDDGSATFRGSQDDGLQAAALGDPPFRYDATVVLDGVIYEATASWPSDVDEECSPCVPLEFTPPLPALGY